LICIAGKIIAGISSSASRFFFNARYCCFVVCLFSWVKVVVGPSGGYGYRARLLARYMPKYIIGNPSFVVQAMPGAGSVIL
jgi:hypothetical protein